MITAQTETAQAFPVPPALPPAAISSLGTIAYLLENSRLGLAAQVSIWEPGFPFGNQQNALGLRADVRQTHVRSRCTGKERDAETGLDYFGARYFSAAQGRFTTPDEFTGGPVDPFTGQQIQQPGPLPYADITNPQSLNKYAYVLNNPLRYTDPDGHIAIADDMVYAVVGFAAITTAVYLAQPSTQRSLTAAASTALDKLKGLFHPAPSTTTEMDRSPIEARTNGPSDADYVVSPGGTAVPVSQGEMEKGFKGAGLPSRPNTNTKEGGTVYEVPTKAGTKMPVRVMPGSTTNGRRVVLGTKESPRTADGVRPKQGKEKDESHIEQRQ